jgi:hypothetical protein
MERTTATTGSQTTPFERRVTGRRDVRIRIVLDDQVNMNMAATLNVSDDGMLMAAGVELPRGTSVTIFPLDDELDARLFEMRGKVVRSYEDIMVSAYADDRFMMGIQLDLNENQRDALRKYIQQHAN